jgi:hypothetical protein
VEGVEGCFRLVGEIFPEKGGKFYPPFLFLVVSDSSGGLNPPHPPLLEIPRNKGGDGMGGGFGDGGWKDRHRDIQGFSPEYSDGLLNLPDPTIYEEVNCVLQIARCPDLLAL